jgi:tRNA dimethylallyltransferase
MTPLLVVITGPTAVGKTDLCVRIAKHYQTEIISADSRQFYKELSIGTAKPSSEEMGNVPHHFIDSHSVKEDVNASDFERLALKKLEELFKKYQIVILTGGSGLFIDALVSGIDDDLPKANEQIRNELDKLYQKYGIELLQEKLKQLDPKFYEEVDKSNVKRLNRAIEVCLSTGTPYSVLRKGQSKERPFRTLKIALNRDREELFSRINLRVDQMIEQGLVEEVKSVVQHHNKNALKTVGYTELFEYLRNDSTLEEAIESIKVNSRRYAKRQVNWFNKSNDYHWFHPDQQEEIIKLIDLNIK